MILGALVTLLFVIIISILFGEITYRSEDIKSSEWGLEQICIRQINHWKKKFPEMIQCMGIHFEDNTQIGGALDCFFEKRLALVNRWAKLTKGNEKEQRLATMEMEIIFPTVKNYMCGLKRSA